MRLGARFLCIVCKIKCKKISGVYQQEEEETAMEEKKGFFKRLVAGLAKTRENIVSGIDAIFSGFSSIDDDFYDEIE